MKSKKSNKTENNEKTADVKTDIETETQTDTAVRGTISKESVYILIRQALQDYNNYCVKKSWKNQFSNDEETAKNILCHCLIETGNLNYLYDNNLFNITIGSWKTKDPYSCSPYIRDLYGHSYLSGVIRGDRGEKDNKQEFRRYEKLIDAIVDYLDLVNRAKRYAGIPRLYTQKDPVFIRELGRAGYYTADYESIYKNAKLIKSQLSIL